MDSFIQNVIYASYNSHSLKNTLPIHYYMSYSGAIKVERDSDNPIDTVHFVYWDPNDNANKTFVACGWDGFARIYRIEGTTSRYLKKEWEYFFGHPVLSCSINRDAIMVVGLASGEVVVVQLRNVQNISIIGSHESPVCLVTWIEKYNMVMSLGFDNLIKIFDVFQPEQKQTAQYKLPAKTNAAAYDFPFLLVGSQDAKIALLHVENLPNTNFTNEYQEFHEASKDGLVKYSCCSISEFRKKIVFGTPDGRILSSSFDIGHNGIRIARPVVSKYQKVQEYRRELVGQINSISIGVKDGKYDFCVFGGTNETIVFNLEKCSKVKSLSSSHSIPCTAISLSRDSEYVVWGLGSDWSKGLDELTSTKSPKILATKLSTSDVTPSTYMR